MIDTIHRCNRCTLPGTYPGIYFNKKHTCNYCIEYDLLKDRETVIKNKLKHKFIKIINNTKIEQKNKSYDCVVAYSGGKDSTYILSQLKYKYGLRILAHTLDNGFISKHAKKNIKRVTTSLGIDIRTTRPPSHLINCIFRYTLEEETPYPAPLLSMMSPLCIACQGMIFGTTINLAIREKIPLMFIGYTPAQYPVVSLENFLKVNSCVYFSSKVYKDDPLDLIKVARDLLEERFGKAVSEYFFKSQYIKENEWVPKVLFPLHALFDYDENIIYEHISKLGWQKPQDTDACSTNCLINSLGNAYFIKRYGYNPYAGQLAALVRSGKMSYNEAIAMEKSAYSSKAISYSCKKLNMRLGDLNRESRIS